MMNYEDFKSELMYELGVRSGEEYRFKLGKANLRNQSQVDAILVAYKDDAGICPQLYVDDYYARYVEYGTDVTDMACDILALADIKRKEVETIKNAMKYVNAENAKERLIMHVQDKVWNEAMLDEIVYMDLGADLIGVVKYDMPEVDAFITVTTNMKNYLHMTESELLELAHTNTLKQEFCMRNMMDIVRKHLEDEIELSEEQNPMFVLTNKEERFGASVLISKSALNEIEDTLHEKFFVLPSSCHEIIAIPETVVYDPDYLHDMVKVINETQVPVKEQLSNNVYRVSNGKIDICNTKEQLEALQKKEAQELQKEVGKNLKRRTA